ncbi:transglutaminase domain-containing protein [Xanthobacteraceae bacterium A53D]
MRRLTVTHRTRYLYREQVSFGQHRLMLRPRDSHGLRLLDATLTLFPIADVNYVYDVFGNSITLVSLKESAQELRIDSVLELEIYPVPPLEDLISAEATLYPFVYSSDDRLDISLTAARHYPDTGAVESFARAFLPTDGGRIPTLELLSSINQAIRDRFTYKAREEEGTQTPAETLTLGTGTCRDFALLFMETVRELGFAANFVTGYLYTPQLDPLAEADFQGAGATHAWATVYLPGAGWIDFDPTNALIGTDHLVRVAVARDPRQAVPVNGTFSGAADAFVSMEVEVLVSSHGVSEPGPVLAPKVPMADEGEAELPEVLTGCLDGAPEPSVPVQEAVPEEEVSEQEVLPAPDQPQMQPA